MEKRRLSGKAFVSCFSASRRCRRRLGGHGNNGATANAVIKGRRGVSFEGSLSICGHCPLRAQCLPKPHVRVCRQVIFFDRTKARDTHPQTTAMKARIDTREGRLMYSRRLGIVEPVFGNLHTYGRRRFILRSRRKVYAQGKLVDLVHNVRKLQGKAP